MNFLLLLMQPFLLPASSVSPLKCRLLSLCRSSSSSQRWSPSNECNHQARVHLHFASLCSSPLSKFSLLNWAVEPLLKCIKSACSKVLLISRWGCQLFPGNSLLFQPFYQFFRLFSSAFASLHWLWVLFKAFLHYLPHLNLNLTAFYCRDQMNLMSWLLIIMEFAFLLYFSLQPLCSF